MASMAPTFYRARRNYVGLECILASSHGGDPSKVIRVNGFISCCQLENLDVGHGRDNLARLSVIRTRIVVIRILRAACFRTPHIPECGSFLRNEDAFLRNSFTSNLVDRPGSSVVLGPSNFVTQFLLAFFSI